jgi:CRP-like cAMP-binding protein
MGNTNKSKKSNSIQTKNELSNRSNTNKTGAKSTNQISKLTSTNSLGGTKKIPSLTKLSSYEKTNINKLKIDSSINFKNEKTDFQIINSSFTNHYLFKYVDSDNIKRLMNKLIKCKAPKNTILYEKNSEEGEYFYILTKGKMHFNADVTNKIEDYQNLNIIPGDCFGDYEIINDIYRLCDVVTDEECIFYVLNKKDLLETLKDVRKKNYKNIESFINENYSFLNTYPDIKKFLIFDCITIYNYSKSGTLISSCFDHMINNNIFLIVEGEVDTIYKHEAAKVLRRGDIIGHRELILNENYQRNIYLSTKSDNCELYSISYNSLISFLKNGYFVKDLTFFVFC